MTGRAGESSTTVAAGPAQRRQAFDAARAERDARNALRADLSASRRTLDAVLAGRAVGAEARTKVLFVLESLPGASKTLTRRRLAELGLDATTPLSSLDDATCEVLRASFPLAPGAGS